MNKLLNIILILSLLCMPVIADSLSSSTSKKIDSGVYTSITFFGQQITTGNYLEIEVNQLLTKKNAVIFNCSESSSSNVTTANILWIAYNNNSEQYVVSTNTITSGTPLTTMISNDLLIRIYNYNTITSNITGNFLIY